MVGDSLHDGDDAGVEVIAARQATTAAIHADLTTLVRLVGLLTSDERIGVMP